jgi:hypothetical protein
VTLAHRSTRLPDWVASTVRPYSDEGVLWAAQDEPSEAEVLRRAVLPKVLGHVRSVCGWDPEWSGGEWKLGDYSFYALSFDLDEHACAYVQVWSEPDEPVLIEVSSGAWNTRLALFVNFERQGRLRHRGFAVGGAAQNWQKRIAIDRPEESERIAHEIVDVLLTCLDWEGTRELRFSRTLESRAKAGFVYDALNRAMLVRVLTRAGYLVENDDGSRASVLVRTPTQRCGVQLSGERREGLGDYTVVTLRAAFGCPPELAAHRAQQVNEQYRFVTAQPDTSGVVLSHALLLEGGVTEQFLVAQLEVWKALLAQVARE